MLKKVLLIAGILFLLASIFLTVYLVRRRQEIRTKAAPSTVLSLMPSSVSKTVGDSFSLDVSIQTGSNQVVGADIDVSYSPQFLKAIDIIPGAFLEDPQVLSKTINTQTGKIQYSLSSFTVKSGTGSLARISFQATAASGTPTSVSFDPTTSVAGLGETEALKTVLPASVTVLAASPPPPPTPTPSPSPTPTPSPNPNPSPVPPATPRPSPSPNPQPAGGPTNPTASPTPPPVTLPEAGIPTPTILLLLIGFLLTTLGVVFAF